jgi:hypothetical protein
MNKKKLVNIFIFTAFFILLLFNSNLFSQQTDKKDVSEIMALKLKQKVILSDEQTAKVKVVLSNYINDITNGNNSPGSLKKTENDISSVLNDKQKAKYSIIEKDFFDEVAQRALNKY